MTASNMLYEKIIRLLRRHGKADKRERGQCHRQPLIKDAGLLNVCEECLSISESVQRRGRLRVVNSERSFVYKFSALPS